MATSPSSRIDQHPDIMGLRDHSERAVTSSRAQAVEALAVLTGLYLAASPWIAGFNGSTTLAVTNLITGLAFAFLVSGFVTAYERTHAMSWAAIGLAIWTIIAPWVVSGNVDTTRAVVSNVITGVLALLLALAMAGMGAGSRSGAGGERRRP